MHPSAYAFACSALTEADVAGRDVIEAGALNVNGSVREHVEVLGPASYTGVDLRSGPGVDVIADAADIAAQLGQAGAVISTEMLEHAADWVAALAGLIDAVAEDGVLVLTTRSEGFPYHDYGGDYWRFSVAAMETIITAAGLHIERLEPDPDPGVFVKASKPPGWAWPEGTAGAWDKAGVTPVAQP